MTGSVAEGMVTVVADTTDTGGADEDEDVRTMEVIDGMGLWLRVTEVEMDL